MKQKRKILKKIGKKWLSGKQDPSVERPVIISPTISSKQNLTNM